MRKVFVSCIAAVALLAVMAVPSLALTTVTYRSTRTVYSTKTGYSTGTGYGTVRVYYPGQVVTPAPAPKPAPAPAPAPRPTPAPVPAPAPAPSAGLSADESYIFQQVNVERSKVGLGALQLNSALVQTARAKSQDMIRNNYFSHQSPTLGSPFDQMRAAGITYRTAGENIAGNSSAAGAMQAWMNSPGHRSNILNPGFTQIGIGVVNGGPYGKMLTQQFIG